MADLTITSLRGGMNNTDPAVFLAEDQCVLAQNVEYIESMLGERRLGTDAIDLPAFLSARDRVPFIFRHLPTADETAAEFWALGVSGTTTAKLGRKTTAWTEITISDTPTLTGFAQYRWQAVSIHGKIHFAYKSNVDRLHVWDGTSMRRSGLAAPAAAPTATDTGSGSYSGTRYFRVRFTEQIAGATVRRSEPGPVLTKAPSGTGTGLIVTRPSAVSEGETHWELEESTAEDGDYYVVATTVLATTTATDSTAFTGLSAFDLSEDVGDYTLMPSARYLITDDDRVMWGGSWEDDAQASQIGWTPVFNASGVGNDERYEFDTDATLDLDTYKNGPVTGISEPTLGGIWVFKQHAIYKLTRTDQREAAYSAVKYTEAFGAIHGSVLSGIDETGQPCVYFVDFEQGPCRIGLGGIKRCGEDLRSTWRTVNINATAVATSSLFYPKKKQVFWNLAVGSGNAPTTRIVLHTDKSRSFPDGVRKGWSLWTGTPAKALTMCLFAENIDDNVARSLKLVPFVGVEGLGLIHRCDTGVDDNGTAFIAAITSKPYWMKSIMHKFVMRCAALLGKAVTGAKVDVSCIRDFGVETTCNVTDVLFTASASGETDVIKWLDNFKGADLRVGQFKFTDVATPTAQWQLNRFDIAEDQGELA